MQKYIITMLIALTSLIIHSQDIWQPKKDNPVELGDVNWMRNYDKALAKAESEKKPVLILFQEVPGCSTCTSYGNNVMSDPLIVEAIESQFIPLCIYNNKKGEDARILQKYGEPTWNNPVVRIVDHNGKNIIKRLASEYSIGQLVAGINKALIKSRKIIPEYLNLLEQETNNSQKEEMVLSMYCFWTGEKVMADIPGVLETDAGFMNGHEVVKVTYAPNIVSDKELIAKAKTQRCADEVYDNNKKFQGVTTRKRGKFRKDKESKYYLYNSPYKSIPMTPLQQLKANKELSQGGDITFLLSHRQQELWKAIEKKRINSNYIGVEVGTAWEDVLEKIFGG